MHGKNVSAVPMWHLLSPGVRHASRDFSGGWSFIAISTCYSFPLANEKDSFSHKRSRRDGISFGRVFEMRLLKLTPSTFSHLDPFGRTMADSTAATDLQQTQAPKMYAIFSTFFALPLIAVALRLVARRMSHLRLWWDDWLILVATVSYLTEILVVETQNGSPKRAETCVYQKVIVILNFALLNEGPNLPCSLKKRKKRAR